MIPESKICNKCEIDKPSTEYFIKHSKDRLYLQASCKECSREDRRERYNRNKERENRSSKLWRFKNSDSFRPNSYFVNKVEQQRAGRLALRLARANLIIELCMKEWEVTNREWLNGRMLLGKYDECATMAIWIIRARTLLDREAIAELFNCAICDVLNRIKTAQIENSFNQGDIIVRMKCANVRKRYDKTKPDNWTNLEVLRYHEYTPAQRENRRNKGYPSYTEPPENMDLDSLIDTICWYYNVEREIFMSDDSTRGNLSKARQVCMYIMNKYMDMGSSSVAKTFDKNHSTACHNIKLGTDHIRRDKGSLFFELHRRFPTSEKTQTCPGEQMIS